MPDNVKKKMFIYKNGRYVVPETPDLENIIGEAIQDDKDIINQIVVEYDEDNNETVVIFPYNILPLQVSLQNESIEKYYFDYNGEVVIDENTTSVAGINVEEQIYIVFTGEILKEKIIGFVYCFYNNYFDMFFNSYYLFHPVTSGGPTLYKHVLSSIKALQVGGGGIQITRTSDSDTYLISANTVLKNIDKCFISNSSTPCTSFTDTLKYSVLFSSEISFSVNVSTWHTSISLKLMLNMTDPNSYSMNIEAITSGYTVASVGPGLGTQIAITDSVTEL